MNNYNAPRGFSYLPTVIKNLLIINGLVALFFFFDSGARDIIFLNLALFPVSGFHLEFPPDGTFFPTQLITYMFLHSPVDIGHLIFNMFSLWMFGIMIENVWGARKFLGYYLLCGIGAGVTHLVYVYFTNQYAPVLGASGAIYGVLVAYAYLFPNSRVNLYFIIPVKVKYFVPVLIAIDLFQGFGGYNDGVAHFAHLGGALTGFLYLVIFRYRPFKNY